MLSPEQYQQLMAYLQQHSQALRAGGYPFGAVQPQMMRPRVPTLPVPGLMDSLTGMTQDGGSAFGGGGRPSADATGRRAWRV